MAESYLLKRMFRNAALISGPDREAPSRQGEDRPPGDRLDRPRLRRAPPPRARPHPPAGDLGGCRDRPSRHRPPRRYALRESRAESCISGSTASRRWRCRSCVEIGKEAVAGEAQEDVLREAAEDLAEGGDGRRLRRATREEPADLPATLVGVAGVVLEALPDGRAVVGRRAASRRRRPPSREGLVLRPPRPAAAALRHARDAGASRPPGRRLRSARRWSRSATASTMTAAPRAFRRATGRRSPRCRAGRDWIWIAGNHDPAAARALRYPCRRHLPSGRSSSGTSRRRPRPWRDRRPSSPLRPRPRPGPVGAPPLLCRRRPPPGPAGLRRLCRRAERPRPRLCRTVRAPPTFRAFMLGEDRVYPVGRRALLPD